MLKFYAKVAVRPGAGNLGRYGGKPAATGQNWRDIVILWWEKYIRELFGSG